MIATQHAPRNSPYTTPRESTRTKGTGLMSSITGNLLGTSHYDDEKFENAIKRCIPAEFVLIASQDDNNTAQEDYFAMDNYDMGRNVPKHVRKANAGACATTALLQLLYENPEKVVADNCRRARSKPLNVLQVSQEIKKRVKKHSKLNARPTISSSRPLGPPRLDKNEYSKFYIVPPGKRGVRRALLIGVITGQGDDLKGPPNDIVNMQGFLEKHCGFQRHNITVLQDFWEGGGNGKPTKRNILGGFQRLVRSSRPGDVCFIGFSGHGGRIGNQLYICPSDYKKSGQVSDEMIMKDLIKAMPADVYTTMVVDCCYSGTVGDLPYVLPHNKTTQKIDSYYDTDLRKEMVAKEKENSQAYQEYKKARAERRLVGRIADVAAVIADTAAAAGKAAINAPIKTAKATADAAVYVGKGVGQGATIAGKAAINAPIKTAKATADAAVFVGKGVGQGVVGVSKGVGQAGMATANVARAAGKTLDAGVRGSTNAATSAVTAGLRGSANAAKTVGKAGMDASKAAGMLPINAVRHSAGAASLAASAAASGLRSSTSAAASGLRSSTSGAASALRTSTSGAAAALRHSTGSMGNMVRRSKSAEPAISCSTTRQTYNYYDEQPGGDACDDDNISIGSAHSAGSTGSSSGKKKKGSFKRVLPKRWNTTGTAPSTKPSEPNNKLESSVEFKEKEEDTMKERTSSKSPTRTDMGNSLGKLSTIHRRRSFHRKEEAFQTAISQSRRELMESQESLDLLDLEQEENPAYGSYSSSNNCARTSSCDSVSSDCKSKQTARTSATSLSSFLSSSSGNKGDPEDDDTRSQRSSTSTSSGKRKSRGRKINFDLNFSSPAMTMNRPNSQEETPKRSSTLSNALKRTGTSLASGAAGAANSLRRSATQPISSVDIKEQAAGTEKSEEPQHDSPKHKRSSTSSSSGKRKSRGKLKLNLSSPAMTMNKPDSQKAPSDQEDRPSTKFSNSMSALSKGAGNPFRRSNTTSPVRKNPFRRTNTDDQATVPVQNKSLATDPADDGHNEPSEQSDARRSFARGRSPGKRRFTAINLELAMEAEQAARNDAIQRSKQEAARARQSARGSAVRPRKSVMDLAMSFEAKDAMAALDASESEYEEATEKETEGLINKQPSTRSEDNTDPDFIPGFRGTRRMTAINRMLAEDAEKEAQEKKAQEPDFIPGFRGTRRMTAINRMLAEDAEMEAQEKKAQEPGFIPGFRGTRRMTAINRMLAEDAEMEAQDRARQEAAEVEKSSEGRKMSRSSVTNLAAVFEAEGIEMSESSAGVRDAEDKVEPARAPARKVSNSGTQPLNLDSTETKKEGVVPTQPRKSVMMMAINFERSSRQLLVDSEDATKTRDTGTRKESPVRPRKSVMMMASAFGGSVGQLKNTDKSANNETENNTEQPKPQERLSLAMMLASALDTSSESFGQLSDTDDESQSEYEEDMEEEPNEASKEEIGSLNDRPHQRRSTAINLEMALKAEEVARQEALERSRREAAEAKEAARKARLERESKKGLANNRPAQRRSTAINFAMAMEAEKKAREEALEKSRREAAEAREAARKARMEREGNMGLANGRPAQRRSTAVNFAMAMEAEEAARKEALERSRREAQEAREAARRARQRAC